MDNGRPVSNHHLARFGTSSITQYTHSKYRDITWLVKDPLQTQFEFSAETGAHLEMAAFELVEKVKPILGIPVVPVGLVRVKRGSETVGVTSIQPMVENTKPLNLYMDAGLKKFVLDTPFVPTKPPVVQASNDVKKGASTARLRQGFSWMGTKLKGSFTKPECGALNQTTFFTLLFRQYWMSRFLNDRDENLGNWLIHTDSMSPIRIDHGLAFYGDIVPGEEDAKFKNSIIVPIVMKHRDNTHFRALLRKTCQEVQDAILKAIQPADIQRILNRVLATVKTLNPQQRQAIIQKVTQRRTTFYAELKKSYSFL
jgi:hypothetical protein